MFIWGASIFFCVLLVVTQASFESSISKDSWCLFLCNDPPCLQARRWPLCSCPNHTGLSCCPQWCVSSGLVLVAVTPFKWLLDCKLRSCRFPSLALWAFPFMFTLAIFFWTVKVNRWGKDCFAQWFLWEWDDCILQRVDVWLPFISIGIHLEVLLAFWGMSLLDA